MNTFTTLTRAQWWGFIRDKQVLFWTIAFPLMFLILFGGIFTDHGASKVTMQQIGAVELFDKMPAHARTAVNEAIELKTATSRDDALEQVRKGNAAAAVEMRGTQLIAHYTQADPIKAAQVRGILDSIVQHANVIVTGKPPTFSFTAQQVEDASMKPIQYVTPGLLGWAIAMGGVFGAAMTLVEWRKSMLLRRIRLAPVSTSAVVASRTAISLVIAAVQTAIFLGVGMFGLGLKLHGAWWMAVPLIAAGTLTFMAIGLFAGAISKTAEAASGLANLLILPMAFLSGSFMPIDKAPEWIQTLSKFLPLRYLNQGLMDVLVRGQGPSSAVIPLLALLGFALVFVLLAAKFFRWDDAS